MNAELLDILKAIQIDIRDNLKDIQADVKDIQADAKDIQADLTCFHEKIDAYIVGDSKIIEGSKKKRAPKAPNA